MDELETWVIVEIWREKNVFNLCGLHICSSAFDNFITHFYQLFIYLFISCMNFMLI